MFSSLRVMGILSQMVHVAYPIVCFPVLVRTFFTYVFFFFYVFIIVPYQTGVAVLRDPLPTYDPNLL